MNARLAAGLVLAGFALLFILQNAAVVEIRFLFWSVAMSRVLFMLLVLAVGVVVGWLLHSVAAHRRARRRNG